MIIKLAQTEEEHKIKAMKEGAVVIGSALALKNLAHLENEFKPGLGPVKRWIYKHNLMKPRLKDTVSKLKMTPGRALQMGAIGTLIGGVLGLGAHEGIKKIKSFNTKD